MAEPVRARRLTDQEGRRLLQIVRRGKHGSVRVRRAMIIMASASGTLVPAIARLVANKTPAIRRWARRENAGLYFTARERIPGQSDRGAVRSGTHLCHGLLGSPSHAVLARKLQACLRWRNAHARHPGVLAAQRRERARLRSERQQRRGRPKPKAA